MAISAPVRSQHAFSTVVLSRRSALLEHHLPQNGRSHRCKEPYLGRSVGGLGQSPIRRCIAPILARAANRQLRNEAEIETYPFSPQLTTLAKRPPHAAASDKSARTSSSGSPCQMMALFFPPKTWRSGSCASFGFRPRTLIIACVPGVCQGAGNLTPIAG
jgi:hypothetical protein